MQFGSTLTCRAVKCRGVHATGSMNSGWRVVDWRVYLNEPAIPGGSEQVEWARIGEVAVVGDIGD